MDWLIGWGISLLIHWCIVDWTIYLLLIDKMISNDKLFIYFYFMSLLVMINSTVKIRRLIWWCTVYTVFQVMEYLKKIVPKMFQNTLSNLTNSIIQQFLDELSFRSVVNIIAFSNMYCNLKFYIIIGQIICPVSSKVFIIVLGLRIAREMFSKYL